MLYYYYYSIHTIFHIILSTYKIFSKASTKYSQLVSHITFFQILKVCICINKYCERIFHSKFMTQYDFRNAKATEYILPRIYRGSSGRLVFLVTTIGCYLLPPPPPPPLPLLLTPMKQATLLLTLSSQKINFKHTANAF